ncbi:Methyltransf-25 domain-containing protein [Mycena chlorophos]|uniref:Methyltransf-25 domain-containing protein n=1 Tax=Mycena chlorophos TaxID=658473 RepID=A0A8H6SCJ3_MYCCL|nr:Methyltransf-25 domain-containing protein [Mycena chlorophos]
MAGRAARSRGKKEIQLTPTPFVSGMPQSHNTSVTAGGFPPTLSSSSTSYGTSTRSPSPNVGTTPPWMTPFPSSPPRTAPLLPLSDEDANNTRRPLPPYTGSSSSPGTTMLDTKSISLNNQQTAYLPTPTQSPQVSHASLGRPSSSTLSTLSALPTSDSDTFPSWSGTHPYSHSPYRSPPSSPPSTSSNLTSLSSPWSHTRTLDAAYSVTSVAPTQSSSSEEDQFHAVKPQPASFVYPSSRTRAKPNKPPTKPGHGQKLQGSVATVQVVAPGTMSREVQSVRSAGSDRSSATSGGSDGTEVGSATRSAPPVDSTFYFPVARTRAHPKAPGLPFGKGKRKETMTDLEDSSKYSSGFLGFGLKSKKATPSLYIPATPTLPSGLLLSAETRQSQTPTPTTPGSGVSDTVDDLDSRNASPVPREPQFTNKIGTYPLDSYDTTLMEIDRQTLDLLKKLNRSYGGPSFHDYGDRPPSTVLDLGCGAGWWLLDAAVAWKSAGTQFVGLDMYDTMRGAWSTAQRQGVSGSIKFVRGNFVKDALPFPDKSFELVRMANLALCIPHSQWESVLVQVKRVLVDGGRLELIEDHVFFPYGKPFSEQSPTADAEVALRRLSLANNAVPHHAMEDQTVGGWNERAETSQELETLFENMLCYRFGIHPRPAEFVPELLRRVFGGGAVKEVATMNLTLAPPPEQPYDAIEEDEVGFADVLARSPGLTLSPSTLVPMQPAELLASVSKHSRVLLSCKNALADYAAEVSDCADSDGQRDAATEALWDYQNFLRERFDPPSDLAADAPEFSLQSPEVCADEISLQSDERQDLEEYQSVFQTRYEWATEPSMDILSPSTPLTSPIVPVQSQTVRSPTLPAHLVLPPAPTSPPPLPPSIQRIRPPPSLSPPAAASPSLPTIRPPSPSLSMRKVPPPSALEAVADATGRERSASLSSTFTAGTAAAPPYSRAELTHVRTFYVYEAVRSTSAQL